jgi:hypothetical protein
MPSGEDRMRVQHFDRALDASALEQLPTIRRPPPSRALPDAV